MNERGLKLFIRGYIYIYTTCSILFEKGMKPLGIGSSEAEVYYLVCKSVYIIQHRAKHRAILKSLFIKKKKNAKNFPREGKDHWTPIFIPFFPILPFVPRGKKNSTRSNTHFAPTGYSKREIWRSPWNATRWRHLLADKIQLRTRTCFVRTFPTRRFLNEDSSSWNAI